MLDPSGLRETLTLNSQTKIAHQKTSVKKGQMKKLTKDLHFNVSWLFNKLLDKQGSVPKSSQCFRVGALVILLKFLTNRQEKCGCGITCF